MDKKLKYITPAILGIIICIIIIAAIFAKWLAPYSPYEISLPNKLIPPSWLEGGNSAYLLGTDELGRDILSRIIYGARYSLTVAFGVIFIAGLIGMGLGLLAGYIGNRTDAIIMSFVDGALGFPMFLLALVLASIWGPNFKNILIALVFTLWARYARMVRADVLSLRERDFVAEAKVIGCSNIKIILRHILPNVIDNIIVLLTLQVGWAINIEAALSFLGAGIPPPTPAWGLMVAGGKNYLEGAWWVATVPGIAILITVLCFNLLGDWMRDYFDPKLREI